jgi:hypothetical protein
MYSLATFRELLKFTCFVFLKLHRTLLNIQDSCFYSVWIVLTLNFVQNCLSYRTDYLMFICYFLLLIVNPTMAPLLEFLHWHLFTIVRNEGICKFLTFSVKPGLMILWFVNWYLSGTFSFIRYVFFFLVFLNLSSLYYHFPSFYFHIPFLFQFFLVAARSFAGLTAFPTDHSSGESIS